MKVSSVIGLVVAIAGLFLGATMEGSNPMAILNPSAMLIVLGGTLGAVITGTSFDSVKAIPKLYMKAFNADPPDLNAKVAELVGYAESARRDGLLALDEVTSSIEDPFTKKGLQLVVDGTDPDLVADILEAENDAMRKRHAAAVQPFDKAGGYAPTMGIIGTVFGLVHVLSNLDKPETLGPSISAAFIATLLGVASANVVYLPISARMKQLSQEELHSRALIVEGILSIQAGDNPRVVQEKLITFVPPALRPADGEPVGGSASAEKAAA
jgi:chemotaxis protein MotA